MLILRIKQAEVALADGRLDEAFELARAADVRKHRSGQDLIGRVARALVERGRQHLQAGRLSSAGSDSEKALQIAGNLPEIAELRGAVVAGMTDQQHAERRRAEAVAAARQQIAQGQLTVGAEPLDAVGGDDGQTVTLLQDVAARRAVIDTLLAKAQAALERKDWQAAIPELVRAARTHPHDVRLREAVRSVGEVVVPQIQTAIENGRLDVAQSLLERLEPVAGHGVETQQTRMILEQCRVAWEAMERGFFREAEAVARRLAVLMPDAKWIDGVARQLRQAAEAAEELRSGPLSLPVSRPSDASPQRRVPMHAPEKPVIPVVPVGGAKTLPARFSVQVDGIGGFRIMRERRVSIGPVSATRPVDVALLADASMPSVVIERDEDDYFMRSSTPVSVNDRMTSSHLLHSGDKISLSSRCRLTFSRPNAASTTALLHVSGARLPKGDIRTIILLDREIMIGPGAGSHVRVDDLAEPVALCVRQGQLFCHSKGEMTVNGSPAGAAAAIAVGSHITAGSLSFVITGD